MPEIVIESPPRQTIAVLRSLSEARESGNRGASKRNRCEALYLISRTKYADLSGMGVYQFHGRWNKRSQRSICTSLEVGTAALEVLSYLDKDSSPMRDVLAYDDLIERPKLCIVDLRKEILLRR
ncbi:MAG: RES domain-containing protein [Bryobacteraceae bacterium]